MKQLLLLLAFLPSIAYNLPAQWISTQGPYGGYITELQSTDTFVYAVKNSGIYRSADVGLNWSLCDAPSLFGRIALDGNNILASYNDNNQGKLRYSSDHGTNWMDVPIPDSTGYLSSFGVKSDILLYSWLYSIWRSDDFGQNWLSYQIPNEPFHSYKMLGTFEGKFYLCNRTRLFSSEDGLNWTFLSEVPNSNASTITRIFKKGNVMLCQAGQTLSRSLDGGIQWQIGAVEGNVYFGANTVFSYENGVHYASCGKSFYRSIDNGLSWYDVNPNGPDWYYHTSQNNIILAHLFGLGVFRSTDGGQTFTPSNHGLSGGDVFTLSLKNQDLWYWDERGINRQNIDQLDWDSAPIYPTPTLFGSFVSIFHFKNAWFIRKDHGELLRSLDNGQTWDDVTPANDIVSSDFVEWNQKNDSLYLSSEHYTTYLSTDLGDHWTLLNPALQLQIGQFPKDIAIQDNWYFVCDNQSIHRSNDQMQSWSLAGQAMPFGTDISTIKLFSTKRFLFALVNQEKVYRSEDQGDTWLEVQIPFTSSTFFSTEHEVVFAEIRQALVAFFENRGIFVSYDNGLSWTDFGQGLPWKGAGTSFGYNDHSLWLGTYYFGIYKRTAEELGPLTADNIFEQAHPLQFTPNPSSGLCTFSVPEDISGPINIQIFDQQGRLVQEQTAAAKGLQMVDLRRFSNGTYTIRAISQGRIFSGQFVKI